MKDDASLVIRGGSWFVTPMLARVATRYWVTPGTRIDYLGLRLARDSMQRLAKAAKDEG